MQAVSIGVVLGLTIGLVAGCGGGSRSYDATATDACLRKNPDHVDLGWYPGEPDAPSPKTPFEIIDGSYPAGLPFYGHLPYYGTNVGSGHHFSVLFHDSSFDPPVHLVVFANAQQARYAYQEIVSSARKDLSFFKRSTWLDQNLFLDWSIGPPSKTVRSIILGCLRKA